MSREAQIEYWRRVHFPWLEVREAHVCLGYRLRPLTLWHAREMERGQLIVGEGPTDGFLGLLACVEACSRRPGEEVGRLRAWWRRRRARRLWDRYEAEQLIRWGAYLGEYGASSGPLLLPGGGSGKRKSRPVKCPGWLYMVAVLMHKGHMSEREAWDCQVNRAKWLLEALCEAEGGEASSLVSAADAEAMPPEAWAVIREACE